MTAFFIITSIALIATMLYAFNADKAHKRELLEIVDTLNDKILENRELSNRISKLEKEIVAYDITVENYETLNAESNAKRKNSGNTTRTNKL